MTRPHCRHPFHLVTCLFLIGVTFYSLSSCIAHGAPCRVCVRQAAPVVHHAAAVSYAPVVQSTAYYRVAPQLEQAASDEWSFMHSEKYRDYLRLQGLEEGVRLSAAVRQAPYATPQAVDSDTGAAATAQPAPPTPTSPEPPPAVSTSDPVAAGLPSPPTFENHFPVLARNCTRCHTGAKAEENGVALDGTVDPLEPQMVKAILLATYNSHMPKGKPLTDEEFNGLLAELLAERGLVDPEPLP